eukprot:GHVU01055203.1.p1 GENE.GHVU01055203.1~~GHVU01055203.1.p1  ORF type:complete len:128 (-),score=19.80 GHVU01055203.1:195-578(-)
MADKLNSEFENVAKQFIQHYYTTFAADRKSLGPLYGENSMLTWEDERVQGATNIVNKLSQLNFAKVAHNVVKCDCQPSPGMGVLVVVTGDLKIDENSPLKFTQVFHLVQGANGGYYIFNDLFRLNIG